MLPTSGMALAGEMVTLTGPVARAPLMRFESAWVMISVGTKVSPPLKLKEMGSPGATRPRITARAPALAARSTLRLTPQAPRSMRAILPAGSARYGSAGLVGVTEPAGQPRPTKATSPVAWWSMGAQPTVSVLRMVPAMEAGEFTTSGKALALGTW